MIKILIFILLFGFAAQTSGAGRLIRRSFIQIEQSSDDSSSGEEKADTEVKKEQDKIWDNFNFQFFVVSVKYMQTESEQYYSSGFYSRPFLPPRNTAF